MLNKVYKTLLIVCLFVLPIITKAQPPNIDEDPNYGVEDVRVPLDTDVMVLVGLVVLYGIAKIVIARWNDKRTILPI